jgi:phosphate-selective porin OprO/OprP
MLSWLLLAVCPQDGAPVDVFLQDGLRFRSRDGEFEARLGGRVLVQARTVFDRPDDDVAPLRSVPDSVWLRQARLEFEASFRKDWAARISFDAASGQWNQPAGTAPSSVTASLRDGWIEWRRFPELQVRVGQFHQPVGQEEYASIRWLELLERSNWNRLVPSRDLGVQVAGAFGGGVVDYALMAANGGTLIHDLSRGVSDRDDAKELAMRIRVRPFAGSGLPLLDRLRLQASGTVGSVDSAPASAFDLTTAELSVLWLDSTAAGTFDGRRRRFLPALLWAAGPLGLQAEALWRDDELDGTFAAERLETRGWSATASVWLTGDEKRPEARPASAGGVELAARVARASVEDPAGAGLVAPGLDADGVTSLTLGLSWWPTRNVRFSLNGVREEYSDPLPFGTRSEDVLHGLLLRAQIDF